MSKVYASFSADASPRSPRFQCSITLPAAEAVDMFRVTTNHLKRTVALRPDNAKFIDAFTKLFAEGHLQFSEDIRHGAHIVKAEKGTDWGTDVILMHGCCITSDCAPLAKAALDSAALKESSTVHLKLGKAAVELDAAIAEVEKLKRAALTPPSPDEDMIALGRAVMRVNKAKLLYAETVNADEYSPDYSDVDGVWSWVIGD